MLFFMISCGVFTNCRMELPRSISERAFAEGLPHGVSFGRGRRMIVDCFCMAHSPLASLGVALALWVEKMSESA